MIQVGINAVRSLIRFVREEHAQDVFEYVLIIGIITVAVLVAVATPLGGAMIDAVLDGVCAAISGIDGAGVGIEIAAGACS